MSYYLFTTDKGEKIEIKDITPSEGEFGAGNDAIKHRLLLKKKLGKEVVSWASMGGESGKLNI